MTNINPAIMAADDILAVLCHDEAAYMTVLSAGLKPAHMPTEKHMVAYHAICALRNEGKAVHDTLIMERGGEKLTLQDISKWISLYDSTRNGEIFKESIRIVKNSGMATGVQKLLNMAIADVRPDNYQAKINELMTVLSSFDVAGTNDLRITASALGGDFAEFMAQEPQVLPQTGLPWLDEITGGYDIHQIWWIVAAYKMRKSSIMLNMALQKALDAQHGQGTGCAIISREMNRRDVNAKLVAMLAIGYLKHHGLYNTTVPVVGGKSIPLNAISSTGLKRARAGYKKWHPQKVAAIDWAIKKFTSLGDHLRIYDTDKTGGGLDDLNSALNVMRLDQRRFDGNLMFIDYMQLFDTRGGGDSVYERTSKISTAFQKFIQQNDSTLVVLAQQNEQGVKGGTTGHSPNVSGGGVAAATADFMLASRYDSQESPESLNVKMQLSRHGPDKVDRDFDIHPASGLMLDAAWLSLSKHFEELTA